MFTKDSKLWCSLGICLLGGLWDFELITNKKGTHTFPRHVEDLALGMFCGVDSFFTSSTNCVLFIWLWLCSKWKHILLMCTLLYGTEISWNCILLSGFFILWKLLEAYGKPSHWRLITVNFSCGVVNIRYSHIYSTWSHQYCVLSISPNRKFIKLPNSKLNRATLWG